MDASSLNRMLEDRVKDLARRGPTLGEESRRGALLTALGLDPMPARTDMKLRVTGTIQREGYRIEKLRYESAPGLLVTAHLYIPHGPGPFPVILNPHGHFRYKKAEPTVQARGISLALEGFAALIVDSPGFSWDQNEQNERLAVGDHNDWLLHFGRCVIGVYVWDLMRGLDYLESRSDMDCSHVGITGTSGGGLATMYAFAVDERIFCAAPVCYATSMEVNPFNGCLCNHVPGVMALGDRSDILAMRAPAPICLIGATVDTEFPPEGHRRTYDKLRSVYKSKKAESRVRLELVESGHDYNRRMREAMVAFFREHLLGEPARSYVAEKRPLTDGQGNPYEVGTAPSSDPRLMVTTWFQRESKSMRDLLAEEVRITHQEPYVPSERLVAWGRHAKLSKLKSEATVAIHDAGLPPSDSSSIELPYAEIDQRLCIYLGLSVPELLAQWLHHVLPAGPQGWESTGVQNVAGDAITTMIASVKTLVSAANPECPPERLVAEGQVASLTAQFLKLYRPDLQVETSHTYSGWEEVLATNIPQMIQPSGRYIKWPF